MDEKILSEIGLSNSEIKVYISLLELGETTSGPIIEKTQLQSSVVHRAIKQLLEKGLISYLIRGKDKHYKPTNPHTLVNYIENKKKKVQDILPELLAKQKVSTGKNSVEMFEGKRAIFTLLNDLIRDAEKNEDYFSFSLVEPHKDKEIIDFYQTYNLRRREKNLKVKVLVNNRVKSIYEKNYPIELLKKANVRYSDFHFPQGIIIFRNQLILLDWQDNPHAVKITNQKTASQFKEFFLEAYNKEKDAY